jgi:hypothetical protein
MREILFRGKRKDNSEWVYGDLMHKHYNFNTKADKVIHNNLMKYKVVPKTVGQFTGLTDKNGKKIFEGDLLNGFEYPFLSDNAHNYFAEVIWFDNCPAFGLYTHKHPLSAVRGISEGNCELMESFDSSQWEVIGNIHDNPELAGDE